MRLRNANEFLGRTSTKGIRQRQDELVARKPSVNRFSQEIVLPDLQLGTGFAEPFFPHLDRPKRRIQPGIANSDPAGETRWSRAPSSCITND